MKELHRFAALSALTLLLAVGPAHGGIIVGERGHRLHPKPRHAAADSVGARHHHRLDERRGRTLTVGGLESAKPCASSVRWG